MKIEDKIQKRMDELQRCMEYNAHLYETLYVMYLYHSVRKLWSALSEEDRDYLQGVKYALQHNLKWDV